MSQFKEHIPHEECGSSDGLAIYEDNEGGINGYCWACDTFVPSPFGDNKDGKVQAGQPPKSRKNKKTEEEIASEMESIQALPWRGIPDRGLKDSSLEHFGIKVGVSEVDGKTPVLTYYPQKKNGVLQGYKVKLRLPDGTKRMWSLGDTKDVDLFGWQEALATGAKRLYITEGEDDAAAVLQAIVARNTDPRYKDHRPAVVSLVNGAGSAKQAMTRNLTAIRSNFKDVVLVFDQDDAGKQAVHDALGVYPSARTVDLPAKDATECLTQGRALGLANAVLFKPAEVKNTRLVWGSSLYEEGKKHPEPGLSWPWQGMTHMTRGIRFGETVYLGAGVKMGKSEIVNTLATHLMVAHNLRVFLAKPEEANSKTIKMVCGKVAGRFFHDPEVPFDDKAYDQAFEVVGDKLCLLSLYQHMGWESLRADIMAAVAQGVRAVFIDPITNLTNGINAGEANTQLQEIAQELAAMAKDLDIVIFIFCHLKAPESGDSHERGGKVLSHQFAGSRAMMRSCNLMLGLEGNKDPDMEEKSRNMRKLVILEDREFGASGFVRLYWDAKTGLFNEVT